MKAEAGATDVTSIAAPAIAAIEWPARFRIDMSFLRVAADQTYARAGRRARHLGETCKFAGLLGADSGETGPVWKCRQFGA